MASVDVRAQFVQTLGLDLVGPDRDPDLLDEVLPQPPSRWYLTGFLVPLDAGEDQKTDEIGDKGMDGDGDASGDDASPQCQSPRAAHLSPRPWA